MASIGQCSSAFRRVNHSSSASNSSSSFSIRSILNLPEAEKSQQCAQTLDEILASCPVWLCPPLVPRVVLPMVNCYNDHSLCRGLINQQQFGCSPQHNVWSSLADKEIPFKGEWPKQQAKTSREGLLIARLSYLQQAIPTVLFLMIKSTNSLLICGIQ